MTGRRQARRVRGGEAGDGGSRAGVLGDEQDAPLPAGQGRGTEGVDALVEAGRQVERGGREAEVGDEAVRDGDRGLRPVVAEQALPDGDACGRELGDDARTDGRLATEDEHRRDTGDPDGLERRLGDAVTGHQEHGVLAGEGERATGEGVDGAGTGGDQTDVARLGRLARLDDLASGLVAVGTEDAVDGEALPTQLGDDVLADGSGTTDDGDVLAAEPVEGREDLSSDAVLRGEGHRDVPHAGQEVGGQGVGRAAVLAGSEDGAVGLTEGGDRECRRLVAVVTGDAVELETGGSLCRNCGSDSAREDESAGEDASGRAPHGVPVDLAQREASCLMRWQSRAALTCGGGPRRGRASAAGDAAP